MILITGGACQGKQEFAKQHFPDGQIIAHFEKQIKKWLQEGKDPESELKAWIGQLQDNIVIMDEIGCGIVPIKKEDRIFREAAGRAGCMLAAEAEAVYRVMAGVGIRIK